MAGLLLLTGTLLAAWHPAVSTGTEMKNSAGKDVKIDCTEGCHSGAVWTWVPRYPSCAAMNSSEAVIFNSSGHLNSVVQQHFGDRLKTQRNGCLLDLKKAQVNDSGTFICTANNQSQHVILSISHGCGSDTPSEGTDKRGQWMKLSCCSEDRSKQKKAKRAADSTFTWMHKGGALNGDLTDKHLKGGRIIITSLRSDHRGLWSCLQEGKVVTELCLEVQEDDHGAAQPTSPKPDERSTAGWKNRRRTTEDAIESKTEVRLESGAGQSVPTMAVWGIAGVLAAILIILLMVGVYCYTKGRNHGTTESEKMSTQMETGKPAGRSAGEPSDAANHTQSGPGGLHGEQTHKEAEDTGEVQYCLLDFNMEEGRAETPRAPETTLYSEVARKS